MDLVQRAISDMKCSTRVGERKAGADRLDDYLRNDDVMVLRLNCNSVQPDKKQGDKMTWTVVFSEVRDYFVKETERGHLTLPNRLFCIGLVRSVFEKATCDGPLLSWNKVYDFILTHLQKDRHANIFGPELMGMLQKFLEIDLYKSALDAPAWNELIATLLRCYERSHINIGALLRCLKLCIERGSLYDLVIPSIRSNVVKFYSNVIQVDFNGIQQHILSYLQGLIELCNENAAEFRGILCAVGETVIPRILQIQSFKEEEEAALVEFLIVQHSLHMPYDCEMNSYAFYAADPNKWKEILRLTYSYCIDIIEDKGRKTAPSNGDMSERFLLLSAKLTKQISCPSMLENDSSDEEDGGMQPKKKMRYKSFNTIISDIYRKPPSEGLTTWMNYFKTVLTNFPEMIENKMNYANLMYLGTSLFNTRYMIRKDFYEYFSSLLEAEKYLRKQRILNDIADSWGTVWDLTIRSISVCEGKTEAVNLLRKILKEVHPTNISPLLLLYVNNSMPIMKCSVQLLAEYLTLTTLPVQINDSNIASQSIFLDEGIAVTTQCPRQALIRWLMKAANTDMTGFEPLVAVVLCSLIVKQTDVLIKQEIELFPEPGNLYNDFETKLLKCSFVKETEFIEEEEPTKKAADAKQLGFEYIVLQRPAERLGDAIQMDYERIAGIHGNTRGPLIYKDFILKIRLHLNVLNVIEKHSIGEFPSSTQTGFRTVLERVFDNAMEKCNQIIIEKLLPPDAPNRSPEEITSIIEMTRRLFYDRNLNDKIRNSLSQRVGLQTLEVIKRVFRSHLANYIRGALNNNADGSMFFAEDLESNVRLLGPGYERPEELYLITKRDHKYEKMSLTALHFLIDYGLICQHKLEIFTDLLKDLLSERAYGANLYLFDASSMLISEVSHILSFPGLQDLIGPTTELLQKLCRGYHLFSDCGEKLWILLKYLTPHLANYEGVSRSHFMILFGTAFKFLEASSKTPKTVFKNACEALAVLAKHDPGLTWSHFSPAKSGKVWALEELHKFLTNKCQEVRQMAADTICSMYEHALPLDFSKGIVTDSQEHDGPEDISIEYQERRKSFLDLVFQKLVNSFDIDANMSEDETVEESVNRTSVTLSCLTRLIFAYPYSQKQTIMFLITMVKMKNIDLHLARRALEYASPNSTKTMCCYLSYILKKSLKLKNNVEDLPYQFFGCETQNAFLTRFRNEICVEYFEQNKMAELNNFANRFDMHIKDLVRDCYGLIMAKLTPGLASHKYPLNDRGLNIEKSNELHKRLITTLGGKDAFDTLMASCIGVVVLNLISLTFEPTVVNTWGCPEIKMAEPVPPHYPEATVEICLEFLKAASPRKNMSLIGYLAKTSHQSIFKILLHLTVRIHDAHDILEKYWRLHHFNFFVNNVLLNEPVEIFMLVIHYVCSFTFNTYLRLLKIGDDGKNEDENLRFIKVVIFLITKLVQRITEEYEEEMAEFFNPVIRGIVSAVVEYPTLVNASKTLLDYLLIDNAKTFTEKIISLDPFPCNIPEFQNYNAIHEELKYGPRRSEWPLTKEFERLIEGADADNVMGGTCTKERLQFLRELLSKRKRDLERLVKGMENKRCSEECEHDPLYNIIQMLISIALSSRRNEELTMEACKCLGEIGPVDLSVLVLPPYKSQGKITSREDALCVIIGIVSGYLSSEDIRMVMVAAKTLRSLFEFDECAHIMNTVLGEDRLSKVLLPFRCTDKNLMKKTVEKVDANLLENRLALNEMDDGIDYKSWLTQLTISIIESFKGNTSLATIFLPLCQLRLDFCEDVFPYVVYMCLYGGRTNPIVKRIMSSYFRTFFTKFVANFNSATESSRSHTPSSCGTSSSVIYLSKLALRTLIRATQFLRRHSVPQEIKGNTKPTPFDNNFWIDINYLDVARAAQYCGAYLTSILYIDIAATELDMNRSATHYEDESNEDDTNDHFYSQGGAMYPKNRSDAAKMEKLLLKAYCNIGEVDAAFGCGSARFGDGSVYHAEQMMDGPKLLIIANGSSVNRDSCSDVHVAQSLKNLGTYNVLMTYLKGVEAQGALPNDLQQSQFECSWRLSQWNLSTDKPTYIKDFVEVPAQAQFERSIYDSIQSTLIKDKQNHLMAVKNGYRGVHSELRHATLESSLNLYGFLSRLQMLRVIEDFGGNENDLERLDVDAFLQKWKQQDRIPVCDFKFHEPLLFLRNVLLRAYDMKITGVDLEQEILDSLLNIISKARDADHLGYADSCATALASICTKPCLAREFEVAKNKWARGKNHYPDALYIMGQIVKRSVHEDELYPSLLLHYGEWLSLTHCERPTVILEKYLQRACSLYEKRNGVSQQEMSKAYITLAKYADAQYQNVTKYISSDVFQAKMDYCKRADAERHQSENMDQQFKLAASIMLKHSSNDTEEIKCIFLEQKKFLKLALRHYLKGLRASNDHDLFIFRAISLWLENGNEKDIELIEETTRIFGDEAMPSYKYVVVLHQLSARLSNKNSPMNTLLKEILLKCAEDHPYHTLPVLLTQASLHKDEKLPKKNSSIKVQLTGRVQAAAEIVCSLMRSPRLSKLVSRMETLWLALIHLANINDGRGNLDGVRKSIPADIMKHFTQLETIAVPTCNIPVLPSLNYKDSAVGIASFGKEYGLVGGINSPKKITCRGTNGIVYNMLLKGQDDLRQDAVMQQVFGVMNRLLQVEPMTKTRRLHIRTYKVIPLSQRTGLIEWVENTQTLGEYLTGGASADLGAHVRYRPNDYKPSDCRRIMQESKNADPEKRYSTYISICEHFKPVFRHFFFENFREAGVFFEKRLAYTRSVATNSIVGYMLGLGDRHVLNILIDKNSAELIHIDLGVAFEQGRILPTPETIPFRLSRDIVDGMGISGAEGVFRKCSEMTMEVLRNNAEIIITVLQVLLYDPLYMWTLSSDRVARVQPSESSRGGRKSKNVNEPAEESANERNNAASRVLLRLRQKLMGIEEEGGQTNAISSGSVMSVDGHVALLTQRAMDPEKLCKLFSGWQPYL